MSASVHYVSSQYYKHAKDFAEFYKSSLMYLAYVSSDTLPNDYKVVSAPKLLRCLHFSHRFGVILTAWLGDQALAVDISLAALLGENVYSFGELLQHPIVSQEIHCFHNLSSLLHYI